MAPFVLRRLFGIAHGAFKQTALLSGWTAGFNPLLAIATAANVSRL